MPPLKKLLDVTLIVGEVLKGSLPDTRIYQTAPWVLFEGDRGTPPRREVTHLFRLRHTQQTSEKPAASCRGRCGKTDRLSSVIANGLDRAAFFGFLAPRFFLRGLRLLREERIATVFVAFEIIRRSLAAQVAVYALVIDEILARNVFRIFVCSVSHKVLYISYGIWQSPKAMASPFRLFHSGCCWSRVA